MNYRHAFHAGNHADVLKHMVLVHILAHLARKDTPFAVLDTHAGLGLYDLHSSEAQRSPEWQGGIAKVWDWADAPDMVRAYRDAVRSFNPDGALRFYPGSPALIAQALRAQDRLAACELHPDDAATLRRRFAGQANVHTHLRDGYEAMGALLPPPERRGLVLIDPPYEGRDEIERTTDALKAALKRFGHGIFVWWRSLKDAEALRRADAELGALALHIELFIDDQSQTSKLVGSSLLIINPPYGLEAALREALPALAERLSLGAAGARVSVR